MKFKKPKFWDLKRPNLLSYLLLPFTIPIRINNIFLNIKSKKKYDKIKTICVGNIYLGGTGKTPTTIKLYKILQQTGLNIFTAKKFYKSQLDEQTILHKKTQFITANDREEIIKRGFQNNADLLIFDDGLQDNKIKYDINFVCFNTQNWVGNNFLIPAGPLREKLDSLKKYDGVFLKENNSNGSEIVDLIKTFNNQIKIFFTYYRITNLATLNIDKKYLIFSGIGDPSNFKNTLLRNNFKIVEEIIYPDHYQYKQKDIDKIKFKANQLNAEILTTEKDYVKISKENSDNIKFLEIDLKIKNEEKLTNFIKSKLNE
jgi:tetraacyldisaccharide 4'-kinase